jgi:uncharacterized protein YndB with AHSA1/START domain
MRFGPTLQVTTPSDFEIVMTRQFDAPRHFVWDAMTKPELIKRWLFGPPGWEMIVCEFPLEVGASYRYVWRNEHGTVMGMGGTIIEVASPERLVASERFDDAWYPGEAIDTTVLEETGAKTNLTLTIRYESKAARDTAIQSGMEGGMVLGYDRLEQLAAELAGAGK